MSRPARASKKECPRFSTLERDAPLEAPEVASKQDGTEIDWKSALPISNEKWETIISKLWAYYKKHRSYVIDPEHKDSKELQKWVNILMNKRAQPHLTTQQKRELTDISFPYCGGGGGGGGSKIDTNQARWDIMFGRLVAYIEKHGHDYPPVRSGALGKWCSRQRDAHNNIRPDRRARLEAINFRFRIGMGGKKQPLYLTQKKTTSGGTTRKKAERPKKKPAPIKVKKVVTAVKTVVEPAVKTAVKKPAKPTRWDSPRTPPQRLQPSRSQKLKKMEYAPPSEDEDDNYDEEQEEDQEQEENVVGETRVKKVKKEEQQPTKETDDSADDDREASLDGEGLAARRSSGRRARMPERYRKNMTTKLEATAGSDSEDPVEAVGDVARSVKAKKNTTPDWPSKDKDTGGEISTHVKEKKTPAVKKTKAPKKRASLKEMSKPKAVGGGGRGTALHWKGMEMAAPKGSIQSVPLSTTTGTKSRRNTFSISTLIPSTSSGSEHFETGAYGKGRKQTTTLDIPKAKSPTDDIITNEKHYSGLPVVTPTATMNRTLFVSDLMSVNQNNIIPMVSPNPVVPKRVSVDTDGLPTVPKPVKTIQHPGDFQVGRVAPSTTGRANKKRKLHPEEVRSFLQACKVLARKKRKQARLGYM